MASTLNYLQLGLQLGMVGTLRYPQLGSGLVLSIAGRLRYHQSGLRSAMAAAPCYRRIILKS